jgi:hypothetical protein
VTLPTGRNPRSEGESVLGPSTARPPPVDALRLLLYRSRGGRVGLPLKSGLLGKLSGLQVHHIFPKSPRY